MSSLEALTLIEEAKSSADVFLGADSHEETYKRLVKLVHPDKAVPKDRPRYDDASRKLSELGGGRKPPLFLFKGE